MRSKSTSRPVRVGAMPTNQHERGAKCSTPDRSRGRAVVLVLRWLAMHQNLNRRPVNFKASQRPVVVQFDHSRSS